MMVKYFVIHAFKDLKDDGHIYNVGDIYPREEVKIEDIDPKRIKELSTDKNKVGTVLIKEYAVGIDINKNEKEEEKPKQDNKIKKHDEDNKSDESEETDNSNKTDENKELNEKNKSEEENDSKENSKPEK